MKTELTQRQLKLFAEEYLRTCETRTYKEALEKLLDVEKKIEAINAQLKDLKERE